MHKSNLQIIQTIYDAASRGDLDTVLALVDPEVTATEAASLPYGGTYHGHEDFRRLFGLLFQSWRSFEFAPEQFLDAGEYIIVMLRAKVGLKGSDQDVTMTIAEFWKLRDGKVIELKPFYWDTAALLGNGRA